MDISIRITTFNIYETCYNIFKLLNYQVLLEWCFCVTLSNVLQTFFLYFKDLMNAKVLHVLVTYQQHTD